MAAPIAVIKDGMEKILYSPNTTMVVFGLYNIFSIPSLITAIGAAIGIRLFGLYEFPRHGSFSYLAIGFAVAAVVCLYLVSPTPVGFDYINTLVSQPIVQ